MIDMLNSFISWFDSLPVAIVFLVGAALIVSEYFLEKSRFLAARVKTVVLINVWQVFGVLFPTLWLLRASESYSQIIPIAFIMIFFGIYKPTKMHKSIGKFDIKSD